MLITHDSNIAADPEAFDRAWDQPETVVILPDKLSDATWVQERLAQVDGDLRLGHFVLLTSGSSGRPKLVIGMKRRAEALATVLHQQAGNDSAERALIVLPLSYSFAFVNQWLWAKVNERARTISPGLKSPAKFRDHLNEPTTSMLCLVGAQVPVLLRHFEGGCFPQIKALHFAGGPFPQSRLPELKRMFPETAITNNYGCTEAMPRLTLRRADESDDAKNVGRALPGVVLRTDEIGKVRFRSPYAAVAHIDEGGLQRYAADHWLESGDLGEIDEEGYLHVRGRTGSVFKRYGEKVSLAALLQTTRQVWPGNAEFYLDEDPTGEPGHVLVIDEPEQSPSYRAILKAMREHHPRAHWPIRIERLKQFPTLANGKPDMCSLKGIEKDGVLWRQRL